MEAVNLDKIIKTERKSNVNFDAPLIKWDEAFTAACNNIDKVVNSNDNN